jgi:hypothetical protein
MTFPTGFECKAGQLVIEKAVADVKDYPVDFTDWLAGDTIISSVWSVPTTITKDSDSRTGTRIIIWLSGGVQGSRNPIIYTITTVGGRTLTGSFIVIVI